jgi:hypothetical protein
MVSPKLFEVFDMPGTVQYKYKDNYIIYLYDCFCPKKNAYHILVFITNKAKPTNSSSANSSSAVNKEIEPPHLAETNRRPGKCYPHLAWPGQVWPGQQELLMMQAAQQRTNR